MNSLGGVACDYNPDFLKLSSRYKTLINLFMEWKYLLTNFM